MDDTSAEDTTRNRFDRLREGFDEVIYQAERAMKRTRDLPDAAAPLTTASQRLLRRSGDAVRRSMMLVR